MQIPLIFKVGYKATPSGEYRKLPYVEIRFPAALDINEIDWSAEPVVPALIDTGADFSVFDLNRFNPPKSLIVTKSESIATTSNSQTDAYNLRFKISHPGGELISTNIFIGNHFVSGLTHSVILGMDFIKTFRLQIDNGSSGFLEIPGI